MFKVGETIKTNTGEEVKVLRFLSDRKDFSEYRVSIDQDIYIMKWFDKELYEGHFQIIDRICKNKWSKAFVSPKSLFRIQAEESYGFGYIVPIISDEYRDAADFFRSSSDMHAARFASYQAMLQACLNISAAVQTILLKGYSFRDGIHPGHFTIHPATGEIFVIGSEGLYAYGVASKLFQYSAPECIETIAIQINNA